MLCLAARLSNLTNTAAGKLVCTLGEHLLQRFTQMYQQFFADITSESSCRTWRTASTSRYGSYSRMPSCLISNAAELRKAIASDLG